MKTILAAFAALFMTATLANAIDIDKFPTSKNVIVVESNCKQGTAADAIMSAKQRGLAVLTMKEDAVARTAAGINKNLKANGNPERKIDGFAMVTMTDDARMVMLYQFYDSCVVSAVMAPSSLMYPALVKLGVAESDWE